MRNYTFRGRCKHGGGWDYGLMSVGREGYEIVNTDGMGLFFHCPVEPETVGQFTGLKDKNGQEIYEGDVVDCHRSGDEEYTVRVSVDDIRNLPRALFGSNLLWREVIGNIHEHPHLLEGSELRG